MSQFKYIQFGLEEKNNIEYSDNSYILVFSRLKHATIFPGYLVSILLFICFIFNYFQNDIEVFMAFPLVFPIGLPLKRLRKLNLYGQSRQNDTQGDKKEGSSVRFFKELLNDFPGRIEMYDNKGSVLWLNNKANEDWSMIDRTTPFGFNIRSSNYLTDSNFILYVENAYMGKTELYRGVDYHFYISGEESFRNNKEIYITPFLDNNNQQEGIVILCYEHPENDQQTTCDDSPAFFFINNISHELRTPLNWILGFSTLIEEEQDLKKIREYNKLIVKGGQSLLSTIEMLVNVSMIIKNENEIETSDFSIRKILKDVERLLMNEISSLNNELDVNLSFSFNKGDDYLMSSDEGKLKQVLMALIHNSLKFTESGHINIGCKEMPENMLLFFVEDTGIGISKDIQDYIFDLFRKGNMNHVTSNSGLGLGLSVAKNYVNLLGGNIWFESESGKGTTFYFTIKDLSSDEDHQGKFNTRKFY